MRGQRIGVAVAVASHGEVGAYDELSHSQVVVQGLEEVARGQPRQFGIESEGGDEIHAQLAQQAGSLSRICQVAYAGAPVATR